jgi:hypothetical protein
MMADFMKTEAKVKAKAHANKSANAYPADQKERGEWVELLFMVCAARRGLKVAWRHGDTSRYDVVVDSGGELYRVQVKSTTFKRRECWECLCFWSRVSEKREAKAYSTKYIDFVAAYVVPEDAWFIIPAERIRTTSLYLPTRARAERSRYGQYLDAWHLLGAEEVSTLTIQAAAESELLLEFLKARIQRANRQEAPGKV